MDYLFASLWFYWVVSGLAGQWIYGVLKARLEEHMPDLFYRTLSFRELSTMPIVFPLLALIGILVFVGDSYYGPGNWEFMLEERDRD